MPATPRLTSLPCTTSYVASQGCRHGPQGCIPLPVPRWCGAREVDLKGDTVLRSCCLTVHVFWGLMSSSLVPWLGGLGEGQTMSP